MFDSVAMGIMGLNIFGSDQAPTQKTAMEMQEDEEAANGMVIL